MISYFEKITGKAKTLTPEVFKELRTSREVADRCMLLGNLEGDYYSSEKKKLPAVTWQAYFKEGERRSNDNAQPNGLFMMDYDHIDNPKELFEKIWAVAEQKKCYNRIMLAHATPSGKGLRLVVTSEKGKSTIAENQEAFAQLVEQPNYDKACKDLARLSFLVCDSYIFYINDKLFDEHEIFIERASRTAHPTSSGNISSSNPCSKNEKEREEILNSTFRGTSYRDIVSTFVEATGGEPQEGERNVKLYNLARKLRYIVDFNVDKLAAILPRFGLSEQEVAQVASSACKSGRSGKIPYDLYKHIQSLTPTIEEDIDEKAEASLKLPSLPPIFDDFASIAPDAFKIPTVMALLPIMGTILSRIRGRYIDGETHAPNFMTVVIAPQASGKSFTRRLDKICLDEIHKADMAAAIKEHEYMMLLKKSKNSKEQPEEPVTIIRCIPASISIAKLLKRLDNACGLHLFSFCEEIDTLTKSNRAGAWSEKSDIYRNAFDNAVYGQDYMSDNSYSASLPVYYNLLLCGTPNAVGRFFKDPEDGLVSRIIFTELPDQFGAQLPKWKQMTDKTQSHLRTLCASLSNKYAMTEEENIMPVTNLDMASLNKRLSNWLEKQRVESLETYDIARDIFRRRSAVMGFRAGMIASVLWKNTAGKKLNSLVNNFAIFIADYVLQQQLNRYGEEMQKLRVEESRTTNASNVYDKLETQFTTSQVAEALRMEKRATPARNVISRWKRAGIIEKVAKNKFKKV